MPHLQQSLHSSSTAETLASYEAWATTYDHDVQAQEYTAPALAVEYVIRHLGGTRLADAKILDAGCGTGLVGQQLARRGAVHIDGVDLSPAMLGVARRTGAYTELTVADLGQPLGVPTGSYDVLTCVGTLTQGHVEPGALAELLRVVVRPGGLLVATVRASVWKKNGYEDKVNDFVARGKARLITDDYEVCRVGKGVDLVYVILQVL